MPISVRTTIDPITKQVRPLSEEQLARARGEFISDVERELRICGAHTPEAVKVLLQMRDGDVGRLEVKPGTLGCTVWFWGPDGALTSAEKTAAFVAEEMGRRAKLAAFGPDPEHALVRRLTDLGVPAAEAKERAERRVQRLDDGTVRATKRDGSPLWETAVPNPRNPDGTLRDLTTDELTSIRDHGHAVTAATRAILAERESDALREQQDRETARIEAENDAQEAARIIADRKKSRDPNEAARARMSSTIGSAF